MVNLPFDEMVHIASVCLNFCSITPFKKVSLFGLGFGDIVIFDGAISTDKFLPVLMFGGMRT